MICKKKAIFLLVSLTISVLLISNNAEALQVFSVGADVKGYSFTLLSGEQINMSEYVGKKCVIIEFWADYCEPCTKVMKILQDYHAKNKYTDIEYLGLVCEWGVPMNRANSYIKYNSITFPQIWIAKKSEQFKTSKDKGTVAGLSEYSLPKRVLIDKTGRVIIEDRKKLLDDNEIKKWLDSILSECSEVEEHMM
jgi:peroxiredoxin